MEGLIARKIDFEVNLNFNLKKLKFLGQIIIFKDGRVRHDFGNTYWLNGLCPILWDFATLTIEEISCRLKVLGFKTLR